MGLLNPAPAAPSRYARSRSLPFLAGFLVSCSVAALTFQQPLFHSLSWPHLLGMALEQVLTASLLCVVTVAFLLPWRAHQHREEYVEAVRRASLAALWIAPLVLFVRENSAWTIVISAILTIFVASQLNDESKALPENHSDGLLTSLHPDPQPLFPRLGLLVSFFAAICAQVSVIAGIADQVVTGAILSAFAFGLWAWAYPRSKGASALPRPRPYSKPLVSFIAVYLLMVFGLMPFLRHGSGHRNMAGAYPWPWHRPADASTQQPRAGTMVPRSKAGFVTGGSGNRGIILWPEKQLVTKLVAPTPLMTNAIGIRGNAEPLVIPFDGVYWFFKSPDVQPPSESRQAQISPETVDIRSTDHEPLSIEAYDHLANLIDLDCCSRIEVAIRNADRYPQSVSLELSLMNTMLPHKPSVSLGRMMVNSTPPWNLYETKRPAINETLKFVIPSQKSLQGFDEVKIVFRLDQARADAGARIAIDHFVLVPRGL